MQEANHLVDIRADDETLNVAAYKEKPWRKVLQDTGLAPCFSSQEKYKYRSKIPSRKNYRSTTVLGEVVLVSRPFERLVLLQPVEPYSPNSPNILKGIESEKLTREHLC
jgi:hypothetical protein